MFPEFGWRFVIPFKRYNYLSEIDPASYEIFYAPLQTWVEISTFFNNYWYSLDREHFCSGLVPDRAKNLGLDSQK